MGAVIIQLILVVLAAGLIVWLVNQFLPIDPRFKQLIMILVVVALVIYIIYALAGASSLL
jgi:hypothetical protein